MAAPVPLRANRAFRRLWLAQALSLLGTSVSSLAYPLVPVLGCFGPVAAPVAGVAADAVGAAAVVAGCAGAFLVLAAVATVRPLLE